VSTFTDRVAVLHLGRLVVHGQPMAALAPRVVRDVFAMDFFPVMNPPTARALLVFDTPARS
jgi:iron complex transport system ATP-binding protein